jgi:hypothetical protein
MVAIRACNRKAAVIRLRFVHRKLQAAAVLAAVATLSACGMDTNAGGVACPAIAVRAGISVTIDASYAPMVNAAKLKTCWDGSCQTHDVQLFPSTGTSSVPCSPTAGAHSVCGAIVSPTGGTNGFVDIARLPDGPIDVTLTLTGAVIKEQTLSITPKVVYPSSPECGGDQRAAGLAVFSDGTVSSI